MKLSFIIENQRVVIFSIPAWLHFRSIIPMHTTCVEWRLWRLIFNWKNSRRWGISFVHALSSRIKQWATSSSRFVIGKFPRDRKSCCWYVTKYFNNLYTNKLLLAIKRYIHNSFHRRESTGREKLSANEIDEAFDIIHVSSSLIPYLYQFIM